MWFTRGALTHLVELVQPWFPVHARCHASRGRRADGRLPVILISRRQPVVPELLTLVPSWRLRDGCCGRVLRAFLVARAERRRGAGAETSWSAASLAHRWSRAPTRSCRDPELNPVPHDVETQMITPRSNRLHLVNIYGHSAARPRAREIRLRGTADETPTDASVWKEYDFCASGGPMRPRSSRRLSRARLADWFAAMSTRSAILDPALRLEVLHNDPGL